MVNVVRPNYIHTTFIHTICVMIGITDTFDIAWSVFGPFSYQ